MKNIFLILFISFGLSATCQKTSGLASACHEGKEGRCTGSAYCSACKNCSRCAHCSAGGSCGVCSSSTDSYYTAPKLKRKKAAKVAAIRPENKNSRFASGEMLSITIDEVNLRSGPGTKYVVIRKLDAGEEVQVIRQSGEWVLIQIKDEDVHGFVHSKYLQ